MIDPGVSRPRSWRRPLRTAVAALRRGGGRSPFEGVLVGLVLPVLAGLATGCAPAAEEAGIAAIAPPATIRLERLEAPVAAGSMAPELALVRGEAGAAGPALLWLEPAAPEPIGSPGSTAPAGELLNLRFARFGAAGWSDPVTVAGPTDRFFANWADRPQVAQGGDGRLWATWLEKNGESTYAYEIRVARSDDGGATWEPLGRLHSDPAPAEHGFVSLQPEGRGLRAVWLDGRNTPAGEPMALYTGLLGTAAAGDADDTEGVGVAAAESLLDASVCDCCATALALVEGAPLVSYRDRTGNEIRDVYRIRGDGKGGWGEAASVAEDGWKIPACPVNGPALATSGSTVWAAWYTAADQRPRVLAAVSTDGGRSFGEPLVVDGEGPLGRVDLALATDGTAVLSWLGRRDAQAEIRAVRLDAEGRAGAPAVVALSDAERASGVPRLLAGPDGGLFLAWIEPGEAGGVRVARFSAAELPPVAPAEAGS